VLAHVHVGEAVFASTRLHLEERKQRTNLFFDRAKADQVVEFFLDLVKRARRAYPRGRAGATASFGDEVLGVAFGKIAGFEQAFADVV
jgi:hypothetical protein